jgi:hypothetical protein
VRRSASILSDARAADYAREISHEVSKFECHDEWRENRLRKKYPNDPTKYAEHWWRLHVQSCRRLVRKIITMVEEME